MTRNINKEIEKDLIKNYDGHNAKFFSQKYNTKIQFIHSLASELKLTRKYIIIKRLDSIIKDYNNGMSIKNAKLKYRMPGKTIKDIIIKHCVFRDRRDSHILFKINENFFEKIDSHIKAYRLGFIYGDGNIYQNKLQFCLAKKDKSHVFLFKNIIQSEHKIYKDRHNFRFTARNPKICSDLNKLGVTKVKSLTLKPPGKFLKKSFIKSFILGYFDADGSICVSQKKKSWTISIVSTKEMCAWIRKQFNFFYKKHGEGSFYKEKRCDGNVWYIVYGGGFASPQGRNVLLKFYNYLYGGHVKCLERKRNKFLFCLNYV